MCGIAGVVSLGGGPPGETQLRTMCDTLVHRGPDGEGLDVRCGVALGMRRLAIIDIEGGGQPYFNEDRTVRAVFNGEIYNFRELRQELEARGHRFASRTDGEVIVHLYEEHGSDFLSRLNGMFALAVHDLGRQRVLLARDRLGIKPLYYCRTDGHLVFGSEIKSLLASGLVPKRLDMNALAEFLAWEYVPSPGTLLQDVRKLEPGELLEASIESRAVRTAAWYDIPSQASRETEVTDEEWADRVDAKLGEAVRGQLVSDVPLGAFLSGGVDSSSVVAGMGPARVFTIGFDDPTYSELEWARRVARHLGVEHRFEVIRPDAMALFDRLMLYMDDPIGDFSIFPTYMVSRLARSEVTVALTGDGGDELFGGYETYVAQELGGAWDALPGVLRRAVARSLGAVRPRPAKKGWINKAKRFVEGAAQPTALEHARWRLFSTDALQSELFTPDAASAVSAPVGGHIERLMQAAGARSPLARRLYVDVKSYLVDNCLVKVDRMSMACSLEVRVPVLDHELVELAFRVPDRLKVRNGRSKILLKRVAARKVPRECVYRAKEGFSIPMKHWLGAELRPILEDRLSPARIGADGLFEVATVERLKREHLDGRANHSHLLWSLIVFQDWRCRWSV